MLGSLSRLIQAATRYLADDEGVDVVRCMARDAFIACGPGSVDRYRGRAQGTEFLPYDEAGPKCESNELGERPGVTTGRVR